MKEKVTKTIGQNTFRLNPLGAQTGRKIAFRLAKNVGPAMVGDFAALSASMNEADFDYICEAFAKNCTLVLPDGKEPLLSSVYEDLFTGDVSGQLFWFIWCLEVNFKDFFTDLKNYIASRSAQRG